MSLQNIEAGSQVFIRTKVYDTTVDPAVLFNPTTVQLQLTKPDGSIAVAYANMTNESTGSYTYAYQTATTDPAGIWLGKLKITDAGSVVYRPDTAAFRTIGDAIVTVPVPAGLSFTGVADTHTVWLTASQLGPDPANPKTYGALGDGAHDDTAAINACIFAMHQRGGGVVLFPPGTYMASQIEVYRGVTLDGGDHDAVELKQIAGSNRDFVISENFAALTGVVGTSVLDLPWGCALRDISINGNRRAGGTINNSTGRGIAFCAQSMKFQGTVMVYNCAETNIWTERPSDYLYAQCDFTGGVPSGPPGGGRPLYQRERVPEGWFERVVSFDWGDGCGWDYAGPGDGMIGIYTACASVDSTDWCFRNKDTSSSFGGIDYFGICHVYSDGGQVTDPPGVQFGSNIYGLQMLMIDACRVEFLAGTMVDQIFATAAPDRFNTVPRVLVDTTAQFAQINQMEISLTGPMTHDANPVGVKWRAGQGYLGSLKFYGGSVSGAIGLQVTSEAGNNIFNDVYITKCDATGGIGIDFAGTYSILRGTSWDNKTCLKYTDNGGVNRIDLNIFTVAGQTAVSGDPPSVYDDFRVKETGAHIKGTDLYVMSANAIDMTSTTVQTVTLAHTCLYTPTARNVTISPVVNSVTDFKWDFPPHFVTADATNLTIKCKLGTASATGGSKGDVAAHIRMGF